MVDANRNLTESIIKKWAPLLESKSAPPIKDAHRRQVTATLLENQERFLKEAAPANNFGDGNVAKWDPILISLVRRAMPNLIAYDICGVQPMTGPTGLIFAMRSRYNSQTGTEALFNEADTDFAGQRAGDTPAGPVHAGTDPLAGGYVTGDAMDTATGEARGDGAGNPISEMAFSIEKTQVAAKTRALKAEYTMELQQDLKAVHGLDAETELANILSAEILAEINREVVRKIYRVARLGAQKDTVTPGVFDLNTDSDGRWSVERFKGLLFAIERDANEIARTTRRGKGNFLLCSSDVASALAMAGILDTGLAAQGSSNLQVDDTGNTFAGTINGRIRVHIDPYFSGSNVEFYCVGYKGQSPYDAGIFYCPYVPLQMVRAVGQDNFQPKIGFRTRYGIVSNPFVTTTIGGSTPDGELLTARTNQYYRIARVSNLL